MKSGKRTGERMRVLILSGNLGDGHRQAALALEEAVQQGGSPAEAEVVDFMQCVYPRVQAVMKYAFLKTVERLPSVYGYFYQRGKDAEGPSLLLSAFLRCGRSKLEELLAKHRPHAVVCTFPLAAAAVSALKRQGRLAVPLVTVITDHTDHSLWLHEGTDLYLTGSEAVRRALLRRGIASSSVRVSGIPVSPRFHAPASREERCRELGLDPRIPVVLIMGGGSGLLSEGIRSLLHSGPVRSRVQLVVVCGSNEKVKRQLEDELRGQQTDRVRLLGFTRSIHDWMSAADLLLTKPGGLTTSEAAAKGLPLLLYKPIPGQEEDNAAVLEAAGLAVRVHADRPLTEQLLALVGDAPRLARMRRQAEAFRRPHPAERAWEAIRELPLLPRAELEPAAGAALTVRKAW